MENDEPSKVVKEWLGPRAQRVLALFFYVIGGLGSLDLWIDLSGVTKTPYVLVRAAEFNTATGERRVGCEVERLNFGASLDTVEFSAWAYPGTRLSEEDVIPWGQRPLVRIYSGPKLSSTTVVTMITRDFQVGSGFRWPIVAASPPGQRPEEIVDCRVTEATGNLRSVPSEWAIGPMIYLHQHPWYYAIVVASFWIVGLFTLYKAWRPK